MNGKFSLRRIISCAASIALLAACAQGPESTKSAHSDISKSSESESTKTESASQNPSAETKEAGSGSSVTNTSESPAKEPDLANTLASKGKEADGAGQTAAVSKDAIKALANAGKGVNINLNELPPTMPICNVGNSEISVADYKRMLRIQQAQANQAIMMNPQAKMQMVAEATKRGISLSDQEKKRLIEVAHQQNGKDPKKFQEFLKQANATEAQFDNEVVLSGLALKTSNTIIEENLLSELVNREMLAQAALASGGEKEAMNKYLSFKHTKAYEQVLKETSLQPDSLKDEMLKAQLAKMQLKKIEAGVKFTNEDLKKIYEANKAQLKHGERIRMSTILIICPQQDIGALGSARTQIAQANPSLSPAQLDLEVAKAFARAEQRAADLLNEAKKPGADFGKIANENSQDPLTMTKKNGGDMGFVERKDIIPALEKEVWKLKPGEILKQVVKSPLGFNVYKVTAKETPGTLKFEEVKDQLELLGKQAKLQEALNSWIKERRKVVKVDFSPKFLAIAQGSIKGKTAASAN